MVGTAALYPVVIANRVPLFYRGFTLAWLGILGLITCRAWTVRPPDGTRLWPWILLLFWAVGLFALRWSYSLPAPRLIVSGPGSASVEIAGAFRTRRVRLDRLALDLVETCDGEGDPYHQLRLAAPGGALIVAEGHDRSRLERRKMAIEAAFRPRAS